jgi:hypothetical protein
MTGLLVNPVHVLDMAVFLPAMLLAGALLLRRRAMGYVLTPLVLTAACTISLGIIVIQSVSPVRGETPAWGVGAAVAVLAVVELVTLIRFLRTIDGKANVSNVVRRNQGAPAAEGRQPEARPRGPERSTPGENVTADPVFEGGHQEENENAGITKRVDEDVEPGSRLAGMVRRKPVRDQHGKPEDRRGDRDAFPPGCAPEQTPRGDREPGHRRQRQHLRHRPHGTLGRRPVSGEGRRQPQECGAEQEQRHSSEVADREHGDAPPLTSLGR